MAKQALISIKDEYTLYGQLHCAALIYDIAKYVKPETRVQTSNIKLTTYMANMTHFKQNIKVSNY